MYVVPGRVAEDRRTHRHIDHDRRQGSMLTKSDPKEVIPSERKDHPFAEDMVLCYP